MLPSSFNCDLKSASRCCPLVSISLKLAFPFRNLATKAWRPFLGFRPSLCCSGVHEDRPCLQSGLTDFCHGFHLQGISRLGAGSCSSTAAAGLQRHLHVASTLRPQETEFAQFSFAEKFGKMTRRCSTRNKARVSSKGGQGDNASEKKVDGEVEGLVKVGQADTEDGDNGCSDALPTEAATTREMQLKARLAAVQKDGNLTQLTVVELREILKMRSRPTIGRKQDLLEELKNLVREDSEPSESGPDEVKVDIVPVTTGSGKRRRNCEVVQDTQTQVTNVDEVAFETKPHGSTGEQDAEAPAISDSTPNPELPAKRRKGVSRSVESKMKVVAAEKTVVEGFKPIWATLCHKKPQPGWIAYDPTTMRPALPSNRANFRKILSWNVNGIRAVLKGKDPKVHDAVVFQELAEKEDFDVLCLQETKLQEKDVDKVKQCLLPNYEESFWSCSTSKAGYSGTAIISRVKPLSVSYGLGIQDHDQEGRAITVEFDSYFLVTSYVPNSGDGLKRLDYRVTSWDPALSTYVTELEKKKPVILTGDFNCSHQEMDLADPNGNRKSAGFTAEERASFEKHFLKKGLVDTFRRQHPDAVGYTYWGYRSGARARNHGWRLDYFLASESLRDRLFDSYSMPHIQGSDHCPIGLIVSV